MTQELLTQRGLALHARLTNFTHETKIARGDFLCGHFPVEKMAKIGISSISLSHVPDPCCLSHADSTVCLAML